MSSNPEPTGDRRPVLPEKRDAKTHPPAGPPKSYSVDEMLTQLRSPDGMKRKRRSEQRVYTARRRRRRLIGLVIGLTVLALLGYFGFQYIQRHRLEGETFRDSLNRRISDALGCQVEFTRIHGGGEHSLFAVDGRFDTWDQDFLESGTMSEIDASLTWRSWNSDEWGITLLSIKEGTIKMNPARSLLPADTTRTIPRGPGREKKRSDHIRFSINPEPDVITLDAVRFTKGLNLEWPSSAPDHKVESIRGLRGGAKLLGGILEGDFLDATVALNYLPELRLEHLHWKLTGRHLEIPGARIGFGAGDARVEITGEAELVSDGSVSLNANIVSTQLKSLLPDIWHERIYGKFASNNATFRAAFAKGPERVFEGDFKLTGAVLAGFGFVNKLSTILRRPEFSRLEFPELTGHFKWTPSAGMEITRLAGEKENSLRLAGNVTINTSGAISSRLTVSASEAALNELPADAEHPFGPLTDGWASCEFSLSGTSASIDDTLNRSAAAAAPAPQNVTPPPKSPAPAVPTPPKAPTPGVEFPRIPAARQLTDEEKEKQFNELLDANKR